MLGAGTIINPIIKIVTTVAILAAIGFFIVKPILDTTEEISGQVNENVQNSLQASSEASENALDASQLASARSRAKAYLSSLAGTWPAAAAAMRACVDDAGDDAREMNACANFGERVVHQVQSNRSRAFSYADSLRAQGRTAEAEQVEACVKDAGFATAPMRRCFNLADELLFG